MRRPFSSRRFSYVAHNIPSYSGPSCCFTVKLIWRLPYAVNTGGQVRAVPCFREDQYRSGFCPHLPYRRGEEKKEVNYKNDFQLSTVTTTAGDSACGRSLHRAHRLQSAACRPAAVTGRRTGQQMSRMAPRCPPSSCQGNGREIWRRGLAWTVRWKMTSADLKKRISKSK